MSHSKHPVRCLASIFAEIGVSFQNVIFIRYINTKVLKNCSEIQNLMEVARIEKR